mmetsp:Transcript_7044/g.20600  ORF Transcript_7044/g.20600 Transcript_7044/m.20600 type:complete len:350 (+) Transcript_7044:221-1270(+)
MAKTTHVIRSSYCARCGAAGATRRCPTCSAAYYCSAACGAEHAPAHRDACAAVCSALRAAAQRTPEAEEQEAVSNLVTVVDFQLSLPPLDSEDDDCAACQPGSPSWGGAAEFLGRRTEGVEAVVDWLRAQAPALLTSRAAADHLLATALRLRDGGQSAEVCLLAWAILERCLSAGPQQFQDALTLQHSSFTDWTAAPDSEPAGGGMHEEAHLDYAAAYGAYGAQQSAPRTPLQHSEAQRTTSCGSCDHTPVSPALGDESRSFPQQQSQQQQQWQQGAAAEAARDTLNRVSPRASPRQMAGLPLVSAVAAAVVDMLAPVLLAEHEDRNPFLPTPLDADFAAMGFPALMCG